MYSALTRFFQSVLPPAPPRLGASLWQLGAGEARAGNGGPRDSRDTDPRADPLRVLQPVSGVDMAVRGRGAGVEMGVDFEGLGMDFEGFGVNFEGLRVGFGLSFEIFVV